MLQAVHRPSRWLLAALVAGAASCDPATLSVNPDDDARLVFSVNLAGTSVTRVVVTVTATDIPTPLVFNFVVSGGVANGTIVLPPGLARTIAFEAFDATGVVTHDGSATIDVVPGLNPQLAITLLPRAGSVPIIVTIGSLSIQVTPAQFSLAVSGTQALTAAITGPGGTPVNGVVSWASTNPALASVDQQGVVTALAAGDVTIVATYAGVAGTSLLTVTGGVPLNETDLPAEADYCILQFPISPTTPAGVGVTIYGRLFEGGLSPTLGPVAHVRAQVGYGPLGTDPRSAPGWVFVNAAYNTAVGNDDEYAGTLVSTFVGTYSMAYRFTINSGAGWTFCDTDGAGSNAALDFSTAAMGTLTIN